MKVIGIGGQLACGKDTLADYLANRLNTHVKCGRGYDAIWKRIGFAHAVKKVFMDAFNVSWDFIEDWKRKDEVPPGFDKNIRKSLQFIGDGFRQIRSNIWIETAFREDVPKVISDVRYLNEALAIKAHGGLTVLVWRPGYENNDSNPSESQIKPTVDWFVKSGYDGDVRGKDRPGETLIPAPGIQVARGGEPVPSGYTGRLHANTEGPNDHWEGDRLYTGVMNPSLFDFFIRNEGDLDQLYKKVDELLVPAIEEYYGNEDFQ